MFKLTFMKKTLLLLCLISVETFAWGPTGHRATGQIAEQYLSAKAKKKIRLLLGQQSLALASTWMDEVRSDSTYNYMTDWHWVTIETGMTYDESRKNPNGDLIVTLERVIRELKAHNLSTQQEIEHIRMLVHLVGDIHQPLHVGCCDDQGGNKVRVKWFRNDSNLHRVWDSDMIDDSKFSYTELAESIPKPDQVMVAGFQKTSARDWANESMGYRKQVYDIGDGNLGYKYSYKYFSIANIRIMQAGVRIAGLLNEIYGK
jgi:S1/P1 Nuclease